MAHNYYHNEGYTRGGLDVVTGVNLFFKGILLFPIFVLAGFVGLTLLKYLVFNGVPSMNAPTEEQREAIQQRDHSLRPAEAIELPSFPTLPQPEITPYVERTEPKVIPSYEEPTWNTEILEDPFS
jgi:hypothetical protein